ncbi:PilW family protein [Variovorax sp. J2P1-59]|uniref:PilW family protein n=1 Tax=Variovorax flavidus TaxID=3053501 RepID=UPI002579166F|nr:PilW family protein [Variovorax sp. J2P1-59]MDM0075143.1 PilW family protein [Variovorax sp. J2P1-59]
MTMLTPSLRRSRGFTLVEVMVGLLLGLLTTLVISEVLTMSEGKKRTLTMGSDAQTNGALSLYTLQRDIQAAGYGTANEPAALGCPIKGEFRDPAAPAGTPSIAFTPTLAPVVIEDGAGGAPDRITVLQSRTPGFSAPVSVTHAHAKTDEFFVVKSSLGVAAGDLMIVVPAGGGWSVDNWCTVFSVTDDGASPATNTTLNFQHVPHVSGGTSKWNRSSVFPDAGYPTQSYLLNLGTMSLNTYEVDAERNLVLTTRTAGAASTASTTLYPQIVNLQAMYGKDTTGDGMVDAYDTVTPTTAIGWQQVLAIRIAVVARSNQYEKDEVTQNEPLWDVGAGTTIAGTVNCHSGSKCLTLGISAVPDWKHYRYKVYDTVVPLRNMLWNAAGS